MNEWMHVWPNVDVVPREKLIDWWTEIVHWSITIVVVTTIGDRAHPPKKHRSHRSYDWWTDDRVTTFWWVFVGAQRNSRQAVGLIYKPAIHHTHHRGKLTQGTTLSSGCTYGLCTSVYVWTLGLLHRHVNHPCCSCQIVTAVHGWWINWLVCSIQMCISNRESLFIWWELSFPDQHVVCSTGSSAPKRLQIYGLFLSQRDQMSKLRKVDSYWHLGVN